MCTYSCDFLTFLLLSFKISINNSLISEINKLNIIFIFLFIQLSNVGYRFYYWNVLRFGTVLILSQYGFNTVKSLPSIRVSNSHSKIVCVSLSVVVQIYNHIVMYF